MFRNYAAAALRNLERNGLYASITIAGLAIGFTAAILIGLYLRHELTYDAFIPHHDRIYVANVSGIGFTGESIDDDTTPDILADQLKLQLPQVADAARFTNSGYPPAVRRGEVNVAERSFVWADPDLFKVLRVPALAGDPATALEAPDAVVLTRTAARKYFGRDAPIGGVLLVDGHPMRVAAVIEDLPSNSNLTGDVFGSSKAPFSFISRNTGGGWLSQYVVTFVELKPGASVRAVDAELAAYSAHEIMPLLKRYTTSDRLRFALRLKPLAKVHLDPAGEGELKPGVDPEVLAGIGVIGVLIVAVAAINFVTLMTARASRRALEVGIRKVVGAERRDLLIQFTGEALLYVALALVLAIALAELLLPALNGALNRKIAFDYLRDPVLLVAMVAAAGITGLAAGLYPAVVLSSFRPAAVLRGGPVAGGGGRRVRQGLVVGQFAVLIALTVAALTVYRQTMFALNGATHLDKRDVVMLFASPCTDALRDAVAAAPGVIGAACSSPSAVGIGNSNNEVGIDGRKVTLSFAPVDFGFFEVYGVRPLAGRLFQASRPDDDGANHTDTAPPIVVNASAARALGFASAEAAVGRTVTERYSHDYSIAGLKQAMTRPPVGAVIIGVVPDFTFYSVQQAVRPTFYYVAAKTGVAASGALNVKLDPATLAQSLPAIDRIWARVSGGEPELRFFADQFLMRLYADTLIEGAFIAVCALIAVVIACLGLFALSAYTAERRTKEIGVRKAMGASSGQILGLLLWQFTWPVLLANLIAWPVAFLAMRWWLQGFAYRVDQAPWTFVAAAAAAVAIGLGTVSAQSYFVARTRPVSALRYE